MLIVGIYTLRTGLLGMRQQSYGCGVLQRVMSDGLRVGLPSDIN